MTDLARSGDILPPVLVPSASYLIPDLATTAESQRLPDFVRTLGPPVPLHIVREHLGHRVPRFDPNLQLHWLPQFLFQTPQGEYVWSQHDRWTRMPNGIGLIFYGHLWPARSLGGVSGSRAIDLRAGYFYALHMGTNRLDVPQDLHDSLVYEYDLLRQYNLGIMRKKVWPHIYTPAGSVSPGPRECWIWMYTRHNDTPVIHVPGANNTSVHRWLWPMLEPEDVLGEDRPRHSPACFRPKHCVNPRHYQRGQLEVRLRYVPDVRTRQGLPGQYPSANVQWTMENIHFDPTTGQRTVVCWKCGSPLAPKAQADMNEKWNGADGKGGQIKGRGHCPVCYQRARGMRPMLPVYEPSAAAIATPTAGEREFEARFWRGITEHKMLHPQPEPEPKPEQPTLSPEEAEHLFDDLASPA